MHRDAGKRRRPLKAEDPSTSARLLPRDVIVAEVARRAREDPGIVTDILQATIPSPSPDIPPPPLPRSDPEPLSPSPTPKDLKSLLYSERYLLLEIPVVAETLRKLAPERSRPWEELLAITFLLLTCETHKARTSHRRTVALLAKLEKCLRSGLEGPLDEDTKRYLGPAHEIVVGKWNVQSSTLPAPGRERLSDATETTVLKTLALKVHEIKGSPHWSDLLAICRAVRRDEFGKNVTSDYLKTRCQGYSRTAQIATLLHDFCRRLPTP